MDAMLMGPRASVGSRASVVKHVITFNKELFYKGASKSLEITKEEAIKLVYILYK